MSVNASSGRIKRSSKDLMIRWHETRLVWRDENSRRFEDACLKPLMARMKTAEKALRHMEEVLYRMRSDCS